MSQNNKAFSGFIWRFFERCGAQGVTFIVSIILAILLEPEVHGIVAIVTIFTTILQVFVNSGLGNALIQKKDADDLDFSSVFYFNVTACILLYVVLFFAAPLIARFYKMPDLTAIVRVLGLTLVISGVKNIQQAYVSRNMLFKRFFFATLGGTIGAAVVGIVMALCGFGVWALVAQELFNTAVDTLILWITVKWRPKRAFSFQRLKSLLSYGWKLLVSALLDTIYTKLWQLIVGKRYSSADLAFYDKGDLFPYSLVRNINTSIDSVIFPLLSQEQDDKSRVRNMTRRAIQFSSYLLCPMMIGLAICAEPLVRVVLKDKWLPCVPFLQIFSVSYIFFPIHTANLNAIKALGRSDLFMKLEFIKKGVGLAILFSTLWFGPLAMACGVLLSSLCDTFINAFPNRKLLDYSWAEQMKDIFKYIGLSVLMGVPVYLLSYLPLKPVWLLLIQIPCGILLYIGLSKLLKVQQFEYALSIVRSFLKRGKEEA